MRRLSVRWRITLLAAGLFAVALGGASYALVSTVRSDVIDSIQHTDEAQLRALAAQVTDGVPGRVDLPAPSRGAPVLEVLDNSSGQRYYVLPDGRVVPVTRATEAALRYERDQARRARETQTRQIVRSAQGQLVLVAQRSTAQVDSTVTGITHGIVLGFPFLVLLVGLLAWVLAGRALRPVEAIRAEAAAIGDDTLHRRVPVPATRDEVARLAVTMNAMLDRLEQASSRQRQFVSDASHELRSPVATIRTQVEVALRRGDAADWPTVAERVLAADARLEQAVTDLVDLARLDETGSLTDLVEVDLDDVALEVCARPHRVTVDTSQVSGGRVLGRRDALGRVLSNLVDNAVRHAEARVSVTVRTVGDAVEVVVADDGPGIAVEDRERVFERFTRLDEGRARDAGGMGLGLAVVRGTVERLGGTVTLDDAEPHGARFTLRFPAA